MSKLSDEQLNKAVDATFLKYDIDKNGLLDKSELIPMLQDAVHYLGKNYKVDDFDVQ
jgi:Ca2+-binding EF-hand superfamily protein